MEEAPPPGTQAIPYLGEVVLYERLVDVAAQGHVALLVNGAWLGKRPDQSAEEARKLLQSRAFQALDRRQVVLGDPSNLSTGATSAPPQAPPSTTTPSAGGQVHDQGGAGTSTVLGPLPGDPLGGTGPGTTPGAAPPSPSTPGSGSSVTKRTAAPGNVMELTQQLELWEIPAQQVVDRVQLQLDGLTKEEVKAVLVRLPSSVRATLELTYRTPDAS